MHETTAFARAFDEREEDGQLLLTGHALEPARLPAQELQEVRGAGRLHQAKESNGCKNKTY